MINVRKYNKSDFDEVNSIIKEAFGREKKDLSDSRVYEFVCEEDNKVVGYFNMLEEKDIIKDIKIFHIGYFCVGEAFRGRGIGHKMIDYAIDYSKKEGVSYIELTSRNDRVAAHKLYSSVGFIKRNSTIFRREIV